MTPTSDLDSDAQNMFIVLPTIRRLQRKQKKEQNFFRKFRGNIWPEFYPEVGKKLPFFPIFQCRALKSALIFVYPRTQGYYKTEIPAKIWAFWARQEFCPEFWPEF